jgi:phage shock protein A
MVQQLEDHKDMVNNRLQDMEIQVQDIRNEVLTAKDSGTLMNLVYYQ